ncbi:MAG: hypothetical protein K6E55_00165 [Thermoguttaceae bacterium]|nr:hypothetical protein [Thermoguttaceae bacterium]
MDKSAKLSGQSRQPQPKPTDAPTEPSDHSQALTYRILCNSEHFLVINPSRKPKKKLEGERKKEVGPRKKIIQN